MTSALAKIERRRKARREIEEIHKNESHVLIIHYSCESFYNRETGETPRITSVVVRNFASGQTDSFSIHKVAELAGCPPQEIECRYDELEKKMLGEFFDFLESHIGYDWVHWNMRDINYGFAALEHRFKVLRGKPKAKLDESRKHDLSRIIVAIYGPSYIGHPRMKKLMEKNGIKALDFLDGAGEAAAFENKEFVKLHQSTLRKADIISNICGRVIDGTLMTDANWRDQYGVHPAVLIELAVKHWLFALVGLLLAIAGLVVPVLQSAKDVGTPNRLPSSSQESIRRPAIDMPSR